jgi:predicted ATPase
MTDKIIISRKEIEALQKNFTKDGLSSNGDYINLSDLRALLDKAEMVDDKKITSGMVLRAQTAPSISDVIDEYKKDAERYRYLRNRAKEDVFNNNGKDAGVWIDCTEEDGTLVLITGEDADEAIDLAMKAK